MYFRSSSLVPALLVFCLPIAILLLIAAFQLGLVLGFEPARVGDSTDLNHEIFELALSAEEGAVNLKTDGRGNPVINLKNGRFFNETYRGDKKSLLNLVSGSVHPTALTRADFDEDAMPDVVAAYSSSSGGILTLRRGNADVISPMSEVAINHMRDGTATGNPFRDPVSTWTIPVVPDYLASGDFNDDGHMDVVAAAEKGQELFWFFGSGDGSFAEPSRTEVIGNITMLRSGEFGLPDGLAELVVGIARASGSVVQISKSPDGAFQAVPRSIDVSYPVVDFALDDLTGDGLSDLVVISRPGIRIIEAPKSTQEKATVKSYELPFEPSAVATGNFAAKGFRGEINYKPQSQIALISSTGDLYLWSKGILSPVVTHFPNVMPGRIQLVRSRVADRFRDGLAILDGHTNQVHIVTQDHFEVAFNTTQEIGNISVQEEQRLPFPLLPPVTLESVGRPIAILSTRYNQDALDDLILLSESTSAPLGAGNDLSVALSAPMAEFLVNDPGALGDGDLTDGKCDTGNQDIGFTDICTLPAAIRQANVLTQTLIKFSVQAITIPSNFFYSSIKRSVIIDGRLGTSRRVMLTRDPITSGNHAMFHFDGAATGNSTIKNTEIFGEAISTGILFSGSSNNVVQGNYIHDLKGAAIGALANSSEVSGSSSITIGGLTVVPGTGLGNVLSGYHREGIRFGNFGGPPGGVGGHRVLGNSIGVDEAGFVSPLNVWGISVEANTTQGTVIGGTTDEARNIISGNNSEGIRVVSVENIPAGSGLLIQGNYIGTDLTGLLPVANDIGIKLMASDHTIGGDAIGARNVISGNTKQGVLISRSSNAPTMENNTIEGNLIGLGVDGNTDVGNGTVGIEFKDGASFNKILDNTISSNGTRGIEIGGSTNFPSAGNEIDNNIIGLNELGTDARPNGSFGIRINNASGTLIGKTDGNIISGNADAGIFVGGVLSTDNVITRNYIGTDIIGVQGFPNMLGIEFHENASNNLVGGTDPEDANLIAYNTEEGIRVISAMGISLLGNSIFMNGAEGIDLDADGLNATNDASTRNDPLDADTGPNGLQNFPVISSVKEGSTIVEGTLSSAPNKTYRIEFFSNVSEESDGLFEGEKFLGMTDITTDGNGLASFMETFPGTETNITATATDPDGNTSEFSVPSSFVVNSTGDDKDTDATSGSFDGSCDSGNTILRDGAPEPECTLRAALQEANFDPDKTEIDFDIPGVGPHTIQPKLSLPRVAYPARIDATTQPGYLEDPVVILRGDALGLFESGFTIVGGKTDILGFSIQKFPGHGIHILGFGAITIQRNTIGVDASGQAPMGNTMSGIFIDIGVIVSGKTLIGDRNGASANIIAYNGQDGVRVIGGVNVEITNNRIFRNQLLGIDLGPIPGSVNGVDSLDIDTGANRLQNYPLLNSVFTDDINNEYDLVGKLISEPNTLFRIEIFNGGSCDISGFGEGEFFMTSTLLSTNGSGEAPLILSIPIPLLTPSQFITATATDPNGNTSEFSNCIPTRPPPTIPPYIVNTVNDQSDLAPGSGVCDTGNTILRNSELEPECSLRAALEESNAFAGVNTIWFDIPGAGPHVIALGTALPVVTDPVDLDASKEPDFDGTPVVVIDGTAAGEVNGIEISAGSSVIQGVSLNGFSGHGIFIHTNGGNIVKGNYIGVTATGKTGIGSGAAGNTGHGIYIRNSSGNLIGSNIPAKTNVISENAGDGIRVESGVGNRIEGNQIFLNGGLGVNLGTDGVTDNDEDDIDEGPNRLQNRPVITDWSPDTGIVKGSLNSLPNTVFRLEFYGSPNCDPSGFGEGARFLKTSLVSTVGNTTTFSFVIDADLMDATRLTVTATDPEGNTSEFSACEAMMVTVEEVDSYVQAEFTLEPNYPNPFKSETTIHYSVSKSETIKIEVYNVMGRKLKTLLNEHKAPGVYSIVLDASSFGSGVYYAVMVAGDTRIVRSMVLFK